MLLLLRKLVEEDDLEENIMVEAPLSPTENTIAVAKEAANINKDEIDTPLENQVNAEEEIQKKKAARYMLINSNLECTS